MSLDKILSIFLLCVGAFYAHAADDDVYNGVPLGGAGSPLHSLTRDGDEDDDVPDFVDQQLEMLRKEKEELENKGLEKDALISKQTEAVKKLKAEIAVYESALKGELEPLHEYIALYNTQLGQLRVGKPDDLKIPLIDAKLTKLRGLLEVCKGRILAADGVAAPIALRAELEAAREQMGNIDRFLSEFNLPTAVAARDEQAQQVLALLGNRDNVLAALRVGL